MPFCEQVGNIGSEVWRALYWKEKDDKSNFEKSAERALELLDLTICVRKKEKYLKELCRLREVLCDYFFNLGNFQVSEKAIKEYFLPFALMANKQC